MIFFRCRRLSSSCSLSSVCSQHQAPHHRQPSRTAQAQQVQAAGGDTAVALPSLFCRDHWRHVRGRRRARQPAQPHVQGPPYPAFKPPLRSFHPLIHRHRHPERQCYHRSGWLLQGHHEGCETSSSSVNTANRSCILDISALREDRLYISFCINNAHPQNR